MGFLPAEGMSSGLPVFDKTGPANSETKQTCMNTIQSNQEACRRLSRFSPPSVATFAFALSCPPAECDLCICKESPFGMKLEWTCVENSPPG